jgi:lipopolysaccharide/colanic/teichoic acid biosynthesis glycosyltransferase
MRRAIEVIGTCIGLILVSPIFVLCALAVKLEDRGPSFYSQLRVGKCFREFRLLKFRSMRPGADRNGLLTSPNDARVTQVGRILRKYKLDELPQLINVLRGDMQLVGPRPEVREYVEHFRDEYAVLLLERPGITDPASVAFRNEQDAFSARDIEEQYVSEILPKKLRLSLEYQRTRTIFSDLKVLIRTVVSMGRCNTSSKSIW